MEGEQMTAKWGRGRLGGRGIEQKEKRFMLSGSLKGAGALSVRALSGQVGGEPGDPGDPSDPKATASQRWEPAACSESITWTTVRRLQGEVQGD